MQRAITGFHRDADDDWVAELACGHGQHVRHKPPWTVRAWVTTEEGRASRLGAILECKRCGVIRPYTPRDREACLALLRSNVPEHFSPREEAELDAFLSALPGPYFVIENEAGELWACGGVATEPSDPRSAALCWGIVRRDQQNRGLGRALTLHRLQAAPRGVERVRIDTSQKVQGFYERLGFVVTEVQRNGFGPGLDRVRMERPLHEAPPTAEGGGTG